MKQTMHIKNNKGFIYYPDIRIIIKYTLHSHTHTDTHTPRERERGRDSRCRFTYSCQFLGFICSSSIFITWYYHFIFFYKIVNWRPAQPDSGNQTGSNGRLRRGAWQ